MPVTLTAKTRSALARSEVTPATWKTRCTPRIARRTERAVEHVAVGELDVEAVQLVERRALAHERPHVVAALDEQARDVRPDETRGPCDEGRHRR